MNSPNIDSPLMTNAEAMAYCRIKDPRVWRRYQLLRKIPHERIGGRKFFHRDILARVLLKAQEAAGRKLFN